MPEAKGSARVAAAVEQSSTRDHRTGTAQSTRRTRTEFTANIKIAVAQEERRLISRRTKEGLARARAEGKTLGRPSQVPREIAERIVTDRSNGTSFREIAAALDADGIPTPGGASRWRPATVAGIYARLTKERAA
ncbi:MAG: recombinase family protein [Micromonosporaceae bacterium]